MRRLAVLVAALAMPVVSWLSIRGVFGPDAGALAQTFPTPIEAARYAFSIWGLIFALDLGYAIWQATGERRSDPVLHRAAAWSLAGFVLTAAWLPVFSLQLYSLAFGVIILAFATTTRAAMLLSVDDSAPLRPRLAAWLPLSLHAGWLAMATALNAAQWAVAEFAPQPPVLAAVALAILAVMALAVLTLNAKMQGNVPFAAAVSWALVAIALRQWDGGIEGAATAARVAVGVLVALWVQTGWLLYRRMH